MREIDVGPCIEGAKYRASLNEEELTALPANPIGNTQLAATCPVTHPAQNTCTCANDASPAYRRQNAGGVL
jgi:hypothetical protein